MIFYFLRGLLRRMRKIKKISVITLFLLNSTLPLFAQKQITEGDVLDVIMEVLMPDGAMGIRG